LRAHDLTGQNVSVPALGRTYVYKPQVLDALARHGLIPKTTTPPEQLRAFLNEVYRYELRRLRDRYRSREFSKLDFHVRVIQVRKRYPLMSIPVQLWTE
jgi:hypothetical protein